MLVLEDYGLEFRVIIESLPEWLMGTDCKSVSFAYAGSNPARLILIFPRWVSPSGKAKDCDSFIRGFDSRHSPVIYLGLCSSEVEQGIHKPLVTSSNLVRAKGAFSSVGRT
jgi:hypothetical protein